MQFSEVTGGGGLNPDSFPVLPCLVIVMRDWNSGKARKTRREEKALAVALALSSLIFSRDNWRRLNRKHDNQNPDQKCCFSAVILFANTWPVRPSRDAALQKKGVVTPPIYPEKSRFSAMPFTSI